MACSSCGCSSGNCNCSQACPSLKPYYASTPSCPEDHAQKFYCSQFKFAVCPESSWNVPLCGQTALLSVDGLAGATVGSFLWHPVYGYFEINSIDASRGLLGIVNNCTTGNASPGTQIPACTCFIVTVPPAVDPTQTGNCLVVDFTAPALDTCVDITLSSVTGLTASDTIQIGTGFYFVETVKPDNIITICNHGEGIAPGTPVIAFDANGNSQYCLSVISSNPCDREAEDVGSLLVCGENGLTVPLNGEGIGWVPAIISGTDDEVQFEPLGANGACTTLTAVFDVVAGDASYVDIPVADSSVFAVGDGVQFNGYTTIVLVITGIADATHITGTFESVPGVNVSIPSGTRLCLRSCCETLEADIINQGVAQDVDEDVVAVALAPAALWTSATFADLTVTNPSPRNAAYLIIFEGSIGAYGTIQVGAGEENEWIYASYQVYIGTATGAIGTVAPPAVALHSTSRQMITMHDDPLAAFTNAYRDFDTSFSFIATVPAGSEYRARLQLRAKNELSGDPDLRLNITGYKGVITVSKISTT